MSVVFIGLGSNLGDRLALLRAARGEIAQCGRVASSSVYETEPWGVSRQQPRYLNAVCRLETDLAPEELLAACLAIEASFGRVRIGACDPRTIDLDVLLYDDLVMDTPALTIPHPRLSLRAFALTPLAELAPDLVHPVLGKTIAQLNESCGQGAEPPRKIAETL